MRAVFIHAHGLQRRIHALPDLLARHAEILRRKGDILLNDIRHDLVVRVLEHHAHRLANGKQQRFVLRVHTVDRDAAARGQQNRVEMLGERRFAAAVVAEHGDKAARLNGQIQPVEHNMLAVFFRILITVMQVTDLNGFVHCHFPVHRPVLPQGRTRPESLTGRPSSPHSLWPPNRFVKMESMM